MNQLCCPEILRLSSFDRLKMASAAVVLWWWKPAILIRLDLCSFPDMDMMHKLLQMHFLTYNAIEKSSASNAKTLLLMAAIHIHSSASLPAMESGLIILRISHYTLLEAVISQLHHRIHAFTTLADNPGFCLLLGYKHMCTISDPPLWQKCCQINGGPERRMVTCLWDLCMSMGNICRPPKLVFGPAYKNFSLSMLILKNNFKEPVLRSIVTHILKWLVGRCSVCHYATLKSWWCWELQFLDLNIFSLWVFHFNIWVHQYYWWESFQQRNPLPVSHLLIFISFPFTPVLPTTPWFSSILSHVKLERAETTIFCNSRWYIYFIII